VRPRQAIAHADEGPRQSGSFLALYALAVAGSAVAYVPFLTLLLPPRVSALAGASDVSMLGFLSFMGAIGASAGGILFGRLSDRWGSRRAWVLAGMTLSSFLLMLMDRARDLMALNALIFGWQFTLNMMIGPLMAWGGDVVPDRQKGVLGGLLAFAPALGALVGALVTYEPWFAVAWRLDVVAGITVLMILPLLLWGRARPFPELMTQAAERGADQGRTLVMWTARLLIQIAQATLFAYLYFWFRSLDPNMSDHEKAAVFSASFLLSVPLSLLLGRWSDVKGRPFKPLVASAMGAALGLFCMAFAKDINAAKLAFLGFSIATTIFLSLHSGQMLRVLPSPQNRARDIGIFNLTNTLPAIIMPWLTIGLVPSFGYFTLFVVLALLALVAAGLLTIISSAKQG
jgi:MFS family permease